MLWRVHSDYQLLMNPTAPTRFKVTNNVVIFCRQNATKKKVRERPSTQLSEIGYAKCNMLFVEMEKADKFCRWCLSDNGIWKLSIISRSSLADIIFPHLETTERRKNVAVEFNFLCLVIKECFWTFKTKVRRGIFFSWVINKQNYISKCNKELFFFKRALKFLKFDMDFKNRQYHFWPPDDTNLNCLKAPTKWDK